MFNKTTSNSSVPARRPEPAPPVNDPTRRIAARVASVLGADLVFEGTISGEGELHVEGAVRGDIHVARLVVGDKAHIEGVIRGGSIEVRGRVVGNIEAKSIKLYETAYVEGDITHEQLSIDVGAYFQGRCQQFQRGAAPAPPVVTTPASSEHDAAMAQIIELESAQR